MKTILIIVIGLILGLLIKGAYKKFSASPEEQAIQSVDFEGLGLGADVLEVLEIEIRLDPRGLAELRINGELEYTTTSYHWVRFWKKK